MFCISARHLTAIRLHAAVVVGRLVLTILMQRADTISVHGRNALSSLPSTFPVPPSAPLVAYRVTQDAKQDALESAHLATIRTFRNDAFSACAYPGTFYDAHLRSFAIPRNVRP